MPENGYCCAWWEWRSPYLRDLQYFYGREGSTDWPCTVEYLESLHGDTPPEERTGEWVYARWFPMRDWLRHAFYCGPEPRACCIGTQCQELSIAECYDAGGEAVLSHRVPFAAWQESCAHVVCGDQVYCCLEYADDPSRCRFADSAEQCEDLTHWSSNPIRTFVVPDGYNCQDVCGQFACCLGATCYMTTWERCGLWGGEPSLYCNDCDDPGDCCPPTLPLPCCLCGGDCLMLQPSLCRDYDGLVVQAVGDCSDIAGLCESIDIRPPCDAGTWAVVPSSEDPEQYELLSTAPILIEDYPDQSVLQHHYAHVGDQPWLCHHWDHPRNLYEKSICGVALNEGGNLGNCIPEGHGAIICGWQPPCPELM